MTSSDVHLRAATDADARAVSALLTELGHPTAPEEVPARMAAVRREGGDVVLAVDSADDPLGLMALSRHAVIHAPGPVGYIVALVTTRAARRRGVGHLLVAEAKAWARAHGCVRLSVTSAEHRADAHAFYPACGMPYTGRRFATGL